MLFLACILTIPFTVADILPLRDYLSLWSCGLTELLLPPELRRIQIKLCSLTMFKLIIQSYPN